MNVLFPITLTAESMAIRGMYLDYDHVSDLAKSYNMPPLPELFCQGLQCISIMMFLKMHGRYTE